VNFLQSSEHPKIASLIPSVLSRARQLQTTQHAGIAFACVVFGGAHWEKAVSMLEAVNNAAQVEVLGLFKAFVQRTHGKDIAQWLSENWKYAEPYHFKLFDHLRSQH